MKFAVITKWSMNCLKLFLRLIYRHAIEWNRKRSNLTRFHSVVVIVVLLCDNRNTFMSGKYTAFFALSPSLFLSFLFLFFYSLHKQSVSIQIKDRMRRDTNHSIYKFHAQFFRCLITTVLHAILLRSFVLSFFIRVEAKVKWQNRIASFTLVSFDFNFESVSVVTVD